MSSLQVYPRNICESRGFQFCNGRIIFLKRTLMILGIIDEDFVVTKDNRIEELQEKRKRRF